MSSRQYSGEANTGTRETKEIRRENLSQPCGDRWQTVLDDPSFHRLLRDGRHAKTTAALLAQLEDNE